MEGEIVARYEGVSPSVIRRLPRYYRFLEDLQKKDVHRISSRELSQLMNLTASQIRQDLNCFGGFGQQGYGYNVDALLGEIGNILGLHKGYKVILIGAGNLGLAIAKHMSFETKGFNLIGIFDKQKELIGMPVRHLVISDVNRLENFCKTFSPQVAILCIPREEAPELADRLVNYGIKGFWNFSHYDLAMDYQDIAVENVHLGDSLMTLCYEISEILE
ncbi:redox-sensing transcriptional repressor [Harryflintia acetispora]|uniref:Redox-sensing transcriptional repressor Rex n=1 Tax=Harryflintia acetispora TaxID=1849041 RepID=A0A9X8UIT0_9FIRM|nr:redox-sensing transcriptional repressor [Harryflintia acetispora]